MESTENGVQAEKKEATKDDSEQVKAEVAPAEKVEKVEKTEKAEETKAEVKVEKAEKTEEKAEEPPKKVEEAPKKAEEPPKKAEEPPKKAEEPPKKAEEPPKKAEEPEKVEEKKVEEVKKEEEKVEETKKSDEKVEEVKETEKVEETVEEVVEEEEEEEEEIVEEEESKEKVEKTETVEKDESSKAKEESEPTEKEETKAPQQVVAPAKAEAKAESDSGSDEELIIEEEEVDEDEEDEEETKEVVIIRRPAAKEAEKKEAAEPKKEVAVTNGEAEEEEVEALTVKLHSKVKVEDEKTESAEPEQKEESPKKAAEPEPVAKAEPKQEAPVREQPAYQPLPQQDYSSTAQAPSNQGYYSYENRDVPQVKRDFSQYDRDVPRVERDYPPHIYTGHKYSYLDRETPRVQREEPPRVQREEPQRFRQEYPTQYQATSYSQWPSQQSHVSYETEEIRETVRETSGTGPMRREVYDERCVRQEYKSRDGSSQGPKQVDLQKIFTPATDTEEIIPKNRKLYASSAFYSPGLHPTVEDQVELARKISHSLSDSNNQQSKGQSMYVNRKKRSVKWVHEGEGTATIAHEYNEESKENNFENRVSSRSIEKVPLKLVMDPRGQVKTPSFNDYNIDAGMQSPEICADIMKSLHAPKGKGAELFAKRRKKSENWIVDETNTSNSSSQGLHETTYGQATGIPSTGQQEHSSYDQYQYSQSPYAAQKTLPKSEPYEKVSSYSTKTETSSVYSTTRDLAYKPSIPRGWNAPAPSLPKNLYTPPGIPLDSYAPPPEVSVQSPTQPSWAASSSLQTSQSPYYPSPSSFTAEPVPSEPTYSSPTKQPGYYSPSKSPYSPSLAQGYKRPQPPQSNIQHATPSITFNPSPLPYEKLEKFDRPSTPPTYTPYTYRGTKSPVVSSFPKSQPTYKPQPKYEQPKYEAPKYETSSYETSKYEPTKYEQPKYEPYQSETQLSPQISRNGYSTTPTYPSKSPVYPSFPSEAPACSRVSPGEVMRGPTFNTAPRGWNQMRDYYRPVTLDDPKQYAHMSYTDF